MQNLGNAVHGLRGWVHRTKRFYKEGIQRFRLHGRLYRSDETLQILVQGSEDSAVSLSCLLFDEKPRLEPLKPGEAFSLAPGDDACVELAGPFATVGPAQIKMCFWLDAQMPSLNPDEALTRTSKDFRRAHRQLMDKNPSVSFTEDLNQWRDWYETMLLPMAQTRHREKAKTPPLQEMLGFAGRASLGLVSIDGSVVAGGLIVATKLTNIGRLWRVGMRPEIVADPRLYKGMNVFLDYLALKKTQEQGLALFSLGLALARVDEGLFRYKTNWGCSLVYEPYGLIHKLSFASDQHRQKIIAQVPLFSLEKEEVVLHMAGSKLSRAEVDNIRFPGLKTIYVHGDVPPSLSEELVDLRLKSFSA